MSVYSECVGVQSRCFVSFLILRENLIHQRTRFSDFEFTAHGAHVRLHDGVPKNELVKGDRIVAWVDALL